MIFALPPRSACSRPPCSMSAIPAPCQSAICCNRGGDDEQTQIRIRGGMCRRRATASRRYRAFARNPALPKGQNRAKSAPFQAIGGPSSRRVNQEEQSANIGVDRERNFGSPDRRPLHAGPTPRPRLPMRRRFAQANQRRLTVCLHHTASLTKGHSLPEQEKPNG